MICLSVEEGEGEGKSLALGQLSCQRTTSLFSSAFTMMLLNKERWKIQVHNEFPTARLQQACCLRAGSTLNFAVWMETQEQTNGDVVMVSGQSSVKPKVRTHDTKLAKA